MDPSAPPSVDAAALKKHEKHKAYMREYMKVYRTTPERRAWDEQHRNTPERKAYMQAYTKQYNATHVEQRREQQRQYHERVRTAMALLRQTEAAQAQSVAAQPTVNNACKK